MKVTIANDSVRKNIELFQTLVQRQPKKSGKETVLIHAFVNKKTGDIHFAKGKEEAQADWKPICIQVRPAKESTFEVLEEGIKELFKYDDLNPLAYAILSETIHTLNEFSKRMAVTLDVQVILEDLSNWEIISSNTQLPKDILLEAWHPTDRYGAEDLLEGCPIGTFLFRKDEYALLLEEELRDKFKEDITCLTITYLEKDHKVSDKTIVNRNESWLFYDDDPDLTGTTFPTIYALLSSLKNELKEPLFY